MLDHSGFIALVLGATFLAGCGQETRTASATPAPVPAPVPAPAPAVAPPTATRPDYVGHWAVSLAGCQAGGWDFRRDSVGTAGEVSCAFKKVTPTTEGYAIDAECTAQAPPELKSFTLVFSGVGPAETMTVAGGPWGSPVALIRCPP
ncbi:MULTISPECIES: hypothetical protein [Phenylobacterium]|uniref:Uncharacterized protein n=1 Tax=Phenylobacterium koreense TaxID=266125 RepID=A0ABV2EDN8_9CAUL